MSDRKKSRTTDVPVSSQADRQMNIEEHESDLESEDEWETEDDVSVSDESMSYATDEENDDNEDELKDGEKGKEPKVRFQEDLEDEDAPKKVFRPGIDKLEEDEELDYDSRAYEMFHRLEMDLPCLSFDIIRDDLGEGRVKYPMTCFLVTGTQGEKDAEDKLLVLKMSRLNKTKHDEDDVVTDSSDEEDEGPSKEPKDKESKDNDKDADAVLEYRDIKHNGAVNRLRCMPGHSHITATWSDTGVVAIYDLSGPIQSLMKPGAGGGHLKSFRSLKPLQTFSGHAMEGFALDWSPINKGRLLTGDCKKYIYLWEPKDTASWEVNKQPFASHSDSVEDLQWAPTEATVFASCSVDQTIKIWDIREKAHKHSLSVHAHDADVNVISWNHNIAYLLASGSDDGSFKIWDLRHISESKPSAHFKWHSEAITSLEWHATDGSVLAVSSDSQTSIWDLSVESDDVMHSPHMEDIPPQLLFSHLGQKETKEIHWHPQLIDVIITTAWDGFNLFKPDLNDDELIDTQ